MTNRRDPILAEDLSGINKAFNHLDKMRGIDGLIADVVRVDVLDQTGTYVVAEVWFDTNDERWKVDFSRYGEA